MPTRRIGTLVAVVVTLGWLVIGGLAHSFPGRLDQVETDNFQAFLPASAESQQAQSQSGDITGANTTPALVVYQRPAGITAADQERAMSDMTRFLQVQWVVGPLAPPIPSQDGQALLLVVPIDNAVGQAENDVVDQLRTIVGDGQDGLTTEVTGPAAIRGDLITVLAAVGGQLLVVTVGAVLVVLLIVYRSPVLWAFPLIAAALSYVLATVFVYWLADADVVQLSGESRGILTVLVFGAGTDYALLLIARYREELVRTARPVDAMKVAWRGVAPAIIASGSTVILGLLALLLSILSSTRALGPVSAIGIACTLLVMLTFLPALLVLGGRRVFWPRIPRPEEKAVGTEHRLWGAIAHLVGRRDRLVWVIAAIGLGVAALGVTQLGKQAINQDDLLFSGHRASVTGQRVLDQHYPGGTGSPAIIVTNAETVDQVTAAARQVSGISTVQPVSAQGGASATSPDPGAAPKVVNGRVQLNATTTDPPDTDSAEQTVRRLRTAVHAVPDSNSLVGGFTATNVDTANAADRDQQVIFPVVLVVILICLAILLRALLAPVLLVLTVVLSFSATVGICAIVFRYLLNVPKVDPEFLLFAFVFLVALGVDYNVFLISRVRQESERRGTRPGILSALTVTGGVITSAGIVLAATFAALTVLPVRILVELGIALPVGLLIDTVVVRSLLVPALSHDIGHQIWWPGRLARAGGEPSGAGPPDGNRTSGHPG
ncbi:MMPL family transporter [Micromonospora sp. WMMA1363]|uniref:MMPL family transporter n=1 Tax=Micromonospora sp. WMMA1363 TaxID=3053985 RepID=UPI00259D0212|nr:MMPL family transporter [Micromonospora sp. WMMA1363]MDM4719357.1 MMPL family transporter [Micromonospora sp. WMMA1363]